MASSSCGCCSATCVMHKEKRGKTVLFTVGLYCSILATLVTADIGTVSCSNASCQSETRAPLQMFQKSSRFARDRITMEADQIEYQKDMLNTDIVEDVKKQSQLPSEEVEGSICIGRHYMDLSVASVNITMSGRRRTSLASHPAQNAIDGNPNTHFQTGSHQEPWWSVDLGYEVKVVAVEITPKDAYSYNESFSRRRRETTTETPTSKSAPLMLSVDGVQCAIVTHFLNLEPKKVPCVAMGRNVTIHLIDQTSSSDLELREVRVEVEQGGMHMPAPRIIICPFLSTLVNEHVLLGCTHSKQELLEVSVAAGMDPSIAQRHLDSNFKDLPEDSQNICDMEGAMNEHVTSTGINDCSTDFTDCAPARDGQKANCTTTTADKSCGVPSSSAFQIFFNKLDSNNDSYLSITEIETNSGKLNINDANPQGEGTIAGSFGFLIKLFGKNDMIHKVNLRRILLERRFPHGYTFGQTASAPAQTEEPTPTPDATLLEDANENDQDESEPSGDEENEVLPEDPENEDEDEVEVKGEKKGQLTLNEGLGEENGNEFEFSGAREQSFSMVSKGSKQDLAENVNVGQSSSLSEKPKEMFSIGRHYVDLSTASLSMDGFVPHENTFSNSAHYMAMKAIDGNAFSFAQTAPTHRPWWQVDLGTELQITAVEITPQSHTSRNSAPLSLSVDGVECAAIEYFLKTEPLKVPCIAFGQTLRIYLSDHSPTKTFLRLAEVRVEVETDRMFVHDVHKITCPFLSTLVNEHVLVGCNHTKKSLLEVSIAAGIDKSTAQKHLDSNFKNLPEDFQNICDMEGAMNEHVTSTGINDCDTSFTACTPAYEGKKAHCKVVTPDKSCGVPSSSKFETFFATLDANKDFYLTTVEIENNSAKLDMNDANPEGEGTIAGSFGFLLKIFGVNGTIHKANLRRVLLERRFPSGYVYGSKLESASTSGATLLNLRSSRFDRDRKSMEDDQNEDEKDKIDETKTTAGRMRNDDLQTAPVSTLQMTQAVGSREQVAEENLQQHSVELDRLRHTHEAVWFSKILNEHDIAYLATGSPRVLPGTSTWPQQGTTRFPCYQKSRDGGDSKTFHEKCDNNGSTSVVIAELSNGYRVGGYWAGYWGTRRRTSQSYEYSSGSFLFSLTNNYKHSQKTTSSSVYDYLDTGPTFGLSPHDLYIAGDLNSGQCSLGTSYNCRSGKSGTTCQNDLCGSHSAWSIAELEVLVEGCDVGYKATVSNGITTCSKCVGSVRRRRAEKCDQCEPPMRPQDGSDDCQGLCGIDHPNGYCVEEGKVCNQNDCTKAACSVTDGTGISRDYPCACGSATCTNENEEYQVCTADLNQCQAPCFTFKAQNQCNTHASRCEWMDPICQEKESPMSEGGYQFQFSELTTTTAMSSFVSASYGKDRAIDGDPHTYSQTGLERRPWWQVTLPVKVRITNVKILIHETLDAPLLIHADGMRCGFVGKNQIKKSIIHSTTCRLPGQSFVSGKEVRITYGRTGVTGTRTLRLAEVTIWGEILGGQPDNSRSIICPFLSTLVNEHVLNGCTHSNETLLEATIGAGLGRQRAIGVIEDNFKNLPGKFQNICDMEGAMNEHNRSTGINDCDTAFTDWSAEKGTMKTNTTSCDLPNVAKFETFFELLDKNDDSILSTSEIWENSEYVPHNDANPVGIVSIAQSYADLVNIFGKGGKEILKANLQTILLERRFPPGFTFGQP